MICCFRKEYNNTRWLACFVLILSIISCHRKSDKFDASLYSVKKWKTIDNANQLNLTIRMYQEDGNKRTVFEINDSIGGRFYKLYAVYNLQKNQFDFADMNFLKDEGNILSFQHVKFVSDTMIVTTPNNFFKLVEEN